MIDFKQQLLDFMTYDIHGIREIISGLRLGMVKRSIRDDFRTAEEALKDLERYRYISFLERKTLEYYWSARVLGLTNSSDSTALMCIDIHYEDTLRYELGKTDFGPLYSAIAKEINTVNHKILSYPYNLTSPYDPFTIR